MLTQLNGGSRVRFEKIYNLDESNYKDLNKEERELLKKRQELEDDLNDKDSHRKAL